MGKRVADAWARSAVARAARGPLPIRTRGRPPESDPGGPRFAVYASDAGRYRSFEVRDLLVAALRELGHAAQPFAEGDEPVPAAQWHVLVAPEEFGRTRQNRRWARGLHAARCIAVSTRRLREANDVHQRPQLRQFRQVWDLDAASAGILASAKIPAAHLALGFQRDFPAYGPQDLEPSPWTIGYEPAVARRPRSWDDRPIDVLFIGRLSERRDRILADLAPTLAAYRSCLRLWEPRRWHVDADRTAWESQAAIALAQRSKIVLHLHADLPAAFAWHRIVARGAWQGALVVSEPSPPGHPLVAGTHFVEATADEMAARLQFHLGPGRADAARMAARAVQDLPRLNRLASNLETMLEALPPIRSVGARRLARGPP
jgi:hypothetical protein